MRHKKARKPHPDPSVEAQLQRITSMQRMAYVREEHAKRVYKKARGYLPGPSRTRLIAEAEQAQDRALELHDRIERYIKELTPADLAYL